MVGNIEGATDRLGAEFSYRYEDIHDSRQRITELIPSRRVVWQALDAHLDFTEDPLRVGRQRGLFEVVPEGGRPTLRISHIGLTPEVECYEKCSTAWGFDINTSLKQLITTNEGAPNPAQSREPQPAR